MWTVIKIDTKKISTLKKEFINKLGGEVVFYSPKLKLTKYLKSKIYPKETYLLGNYMLCFHKNFAKKSFIESLRYSKVKVFFK